MIRIGGEQSAMARWQELEAILVSTARKGSSRASELGQSPKANPSIAQLPTK